MYYHPFKGGVRMIANADGSVTLRGRQRIHAVDTEPGFWERYGHGRKGMRRNPGSKILGMDPMTALLVGAGIFLLYRHSQGATAPGSAAFWSGTSTDALAAWRAGEHGADVIDPMAGATELSVDWGSMPEWTQR